MGKGGGGSKSYDYRATIAGAVCRGPVDELKAILVDGKMQWPEADPWNDGGYQIGTIGRSRTGNEVSVYVTGDLKINAGETISVSGLSGTGFNTTMSATVTGVFWERGTGWRIVYANTGANVAYTVDTGGQVSKRKAYAAGGLVLADGAVWKCLLSHTSDASNRPGNALFWSPYQLTRAADMNGSGYTTVTLPKHGSLRFYWGTDTQAVDALLADSARTGGQVHPSYLGVCYVVLDDFLFGRERQSAPNIEVVVSRSPKQSAVGGTAAGLTDAQANGAAFLAEVLTDELAGAGAGIDRLDLSTFQLAADGLHADVALSGVSPVLREQTTLRGVASNLYDVTDMWMRFNHETGLVEAGRFSRGVEPTTFTTLTADHLTAPPRLTFSGWTKATTGAVVRFTDRERNFKDSPTRPVIDPRARAVIGEPREQSLDRPWIVRRRQAEAHAMEVQRTKGTPGMTAELRVRRTIGLGIRPGDWVRIDMDLEPGGTQLLQFCKVLSRRVQKTGDVTLNVEADTTLAPVPYSPTPGNPLVDEAEKPEALGDVRIFDCPPQLSDGAFGRVVVLARRPTALHTGFLVLFDSTLDVDSDFAEIGQQKFFAVRCDLATDLAVDADTDADRLVPASTVSSSVLRIVVPAQKDDTLLSDTPPMAIGAADDTLLMVILQLDGSGRIAENADGTPQMEVMSVEQFTAYASGGASPAYAVTALRARRGTKKAAFTAASSEVWLIRREALTPLYHADFAVLRANRALGDSPDSGLFRMRPFTARATRPEADCPDLTFRWPGQSLAVPRIAWTAPGNTSWPYTFSTSAGGTLRVRATITDGDGNLTGYRLSYVLAGSAADTLIDSGKPTTGSSYTVDRTIAFSTPGTYTLTATAVDADGLTVKTSVGIIVPEAVPGTTTATPTFSPDGGDFLTWPRSVTIACATSGASITYWVTPTADPGSPTPTSGGWSALAAAPVTALVYRNRYLHAQARKSGMADSAVKTAFFEAPNSF